MGTTLPVILVLDAALPTTERQPYEVRGARFIPVESFLDSDSTPPTVERIWMSKQLPELTRKRINELAAERNLIVSSSFGLVGLREWLHKQLPIYVPTTKTNGNGNAKASTYTGRGRPLNNRPAQPPSSDQEVLLRLEGQLANALDAKQFAEASLDRAVRLNNQLNERLTRANVTIANLRSSLATVKDAATNALKPEKK